MNYTFCKVLNILTTFYYNVWCTADVARMNESRQALEGTLQSLNTQKEEIQKVIWQK